MQRAIVLRDEICDILDSLKITPYLVGPVVKDGRIYMNVVVKDSIMLRGWMPSDSPYPIRVYKSKWPVNLGELERTQIPEVYNP